MGNSVQPMISVIVPCYNYGDLLKDCIASLFAQTYQNWECIIIDDGSIDNTKIIAEEFVQKDKRISYFFQPNSGPTVARNYGLSLAKGIYIQFIDADDLIEPRKFEIQLSCFEKKSECDIVYSSVKYFPSSDKTKRYDDITLEGSKPWMKNLSGKGDKMILALLEGNIMVINSPLVKKSLFDRLCTMSSDLFFNEDWELWTRFAIGDAYFQFDDSLDTLALVRVHESYSKDIFKMYAYGLLACLKINTNLSGRKYKRIMIPKINYHKRIIDEKLIELLRLDRVKAIAKVEFIATLTGIKRYSLYQVLFKSYPFWFCYLYSRFVFIIHKLKNVIIYA